MKAVLIIDDESTILTIARLALSRNFRVLTAETGPAGLEILKQETIDLLITDQRMPDMTGVEVLKQARILYPALVTILSTGFTEDDDIQLALKELGVYRVIYKPWSPKQLRALILEALAPGATSS